MQTNPTHMLGTEYNWLVNLTYNLDGVPKVRLTVTGLLTLFIAIFCFLCLALQAAQPSGAVGAEQPEKTSIHRAGFTQGTPRQPTPAVSTGSR